MLCDKPLLPTRRILAMALSVALLGVVSPAWAHPATDDDAAGNKKDIRVYQMGDDDENEAEDQDDQDDQGNQSGRDQVYRYKVERADAKGGYLGVRVQDITRALMKARDLPTDEGAMVSSVEDGSPADDAGIARGDVIVEVNRRAIKDSGELIKTMSDIKPGSKVDVVVVRDGLRKTMKVEVAKRSNDVMMVAPDLRWRSDGRMNPDQMRQMRELRGRLREMDPETMQQMKGNMRMMMPGPEFRQQLDQLREEVESLKDQIRELKDELHGSRDDDSRENGSRSRRSGS